MQYLLRIKSFVLALLFLPLGLWAQQEGHVVRGKVVEAVGDGHAEHGHERAIIGANVYWAGTTQGTATDGQGAFKLRRIEGNDQLVVSYIGYTNDTINVSNTNFVEVELSETITLKVVEIKGERNTTEIDFKDPLKVELISDKELLKAACCNLSESFETTPSVDVSFTDAVSGTRQVQMLGLAGPYTQITRENMPDIRGLSAIYGLTYVPGTWIRGINLSKGTGSVVNGYESIAGQIDVQLRSPAEMKKLYLNVYANEESRLEANAIVKFKLGDKWSTGLLLHAKNSNVEHDRNNDSFMDHPLGTNLIALNRWEMRSDEGMHVEFGAKVTYIDNTGGQVGFKGTEHQENNNLWGMHMKVQRYEGWTKIGKVSQRFNWRSVGFQMSAASHDQHSHFGRTNYNAHQNTFYSNLIYQSIIGNTNNKIKVGTSLQYDDYDETFNAEVFDRQEVVPGAFVEYTRDYADKLNIVAGLRADHHNLFGAFVTPRLHVRYAMSENTVLRLAGGRGQRTANVISENSGLLASSRQLIFLGNDPDKPYGLEAEVAWNYGLNLTQYFELDYRDGSISFDYYRTDFSNQIVIDLENPREALIYNLDGSSFSNSFQVQLDYELIKRLDMRVAYRWFDVQTTYQSGLKRKPLIAPHRAFINLGYKTRNHWNFDYTVNWQGSKRLPDTSLNPEPYQLEANSPSYVLMNMQISKTWKESFEVYIGAENLTDYKQTNAIVANEDPFGPYFDSSMIWGPVFGRSIYGGIRFTLQ